MSYTFQKYDPISHSIVTLEGDWNSLLDYVLGNGNTIHDITNPIIGVPSFTLSTGSDGAGTMDFRCWIIISVTRVSNAGGYLVEYKRDSDSIWSVINYAQPSGGIITIQTPDLHENTLYDVRMCAIGQVGGMGPWSNIQTIVTPANTIAYPIPTNVTATVILGGIILNWDDLRTVGYKDINYRIYYNTVNNAATAIVVATTTNPFYLWIVQNPNTDYNIKYFWITTVSPSGLESLKSDVVSGTPLKGIESPPLEYPIFTLTNQSNSDSIFFNTWVQISFAPMTTSSTQSGGITTIGGYQVQYKISTDTNWSLISVDQTLVNPINIITGYLKTNTVYDFKVCAVNISGLVGTFSNIQQITTLNNTGIPSTITGLIATGIYNGVLLQWTSVGILNGLGTYKIYKNTSNNSVTATLVGETSTAGYLWQVKNSPADFVTQYFWVALMNNGGLTGSKGTMVSAIPLKVDNNFLNSTVTIAAGNIIIAGNTTFGSWIDGTTTTINGSHITAGSIQVDRLAAGAITIGNFSQGDIDKWNMFDGWKYGNTTYIDGGDIYTGSITAGKLTVAGINSTTGKLDPTQFTTTINGNVITTGTVNLDRLITGTKLQNGQTVIDGGQIATNSITNSQLNSALTLQAPQIILNGQVTIGNWLTGSGLTNGTTTINGSSITLGSIYGQQVNAGSIASTVESLLTLNADKIKLNGTTEFLASWQDGTGSTQIRGGAIAANSITLQTLKDSTSVDPVDNITRINGGVILTNSITATQITTAWLYGLQITTSQLGDTGQRVTMNQWGIRGWNYNNDLQFEIRSGDGKGWFAGGTAYLDSAGITFNNGIINFIENGTQRGIIATNTGHIGGTTGLLIDCPNGDVRITTASGTGANGGHIYLLPSAAQGGIVYTKNVYPDAGSDFSIGNPSDYRWKYGYFDLFSCNRFGNASNVIMNCSLVPDNENGSWSIGNGSQYWASGYFENGHFSNLMVSTVGSNGTGGVKSHLIPENTGAYSSYYLGDASHLWHSLYAFEARVGNLYTTGTTQVALTTTTANIVYSTSKGSGVLGCAGSSIRYKENIEYLNDASWIYNLKPVRFDWKNKVQSKAEGKRIGLIAEDVNELCTELMCYDEQKRPDDVHYEWLSVPIIIEMKKLRTELKTLRDELNSLKKNI